MKRPNFVSIMLLITGLVYHHNGANDWLAPSTIPDDLTPQQIANEITANVLLSAALIVFALSPMKSKEA